MGEAKFRRGRLKDRLLVPGALCTYWGGRAAAETIDHMPPITIFDGRQRPAGLEFPSCSACNSGSRAAEQVIGLISRVSAAKLPQLRLVEPTLIPRLRYGVPSRITRAKFVQHRRRRRPKLWVSQVSAAL